ncbi:RusA family crossover junction endodeoxyribonuclease [Weissella muntiaci]|uniref:RusA family crossover junction endodeoxyribonuclease n=1 Tax=Weissella muntiaci TaxID=2508881 RepID=A0A6C2CBL4_9LACO|nr:RusA family crossover junction endodeoxyribonuclease [Weissella muntiaci]TYC50859.1 RusA family crossover junction endodeoxyribonuclease [Weissella muntiaci]
MIYVQAEVVLPMTHASGNQMEHNTHTNTVFRTAGYHKYQKYIVDSLQELGDELGWKVPKGTALQLKMLFTYPVPESKVNTKAKRAAFEAGKIYPITRGTVDLDNSTKAAADALQEAFDFDDSQFIFEMLGKKYGLDNRLYIEISDAEVDW